MQLYIYDCGELYPVEETSFSFTTWEISLLAKGIVLKFNLRSDMPYTINLPLILDLLYYKSYKSFEHYSRNDLWQQASPINRCWHTWHNHTEMN